MSDGEVEDIDL